MQKVDTIILSNYDGGYYWSLAIDERMYSCVENRNNKFLNEIDYLINSCLNSNKVEKAIDLIRKNYKFNKLIYCENGGIDIYYGNFKI